MSTAPSAPGWAPQHVINAALASFTNGVPEGKGGRVPADVPPFIPSARFIGQRQGYAFGSGEQGLGYYRDAKQPLPEEIVGDDNGGEQAEDDAAAARPAPQLDPEQLLKAAEEEANVDQIQLLDVKGLRRLIVGFEKKYKENLEMRMKHADAPERFLESEVDLDEHLRSLMQVAGSPELYPVLINSGAVLNLLNCVMHENTDIAADAIELLMELTGADAVEEAREEARGLVDALLENNALELLVQRLGSLKETADEEATAVNNLLNVFENMIEVVPAVAETLVAETRLLKWLLARLKPREFDPNKQYASELLAILVQGSEANQRALGEANGIDLLLQAVAAYKGKDPATFEEGEYLNNCFDVLCSAMLLPANKAAFVKAEGVELMVLMLHSKRQCRYGALKALDYASTRYSAPCEKLVEHGGLKHLFGVFMGKARIKGPQDERDINKEIEERSVSLIASLLGGINKGSRRDRVSAKFVESEFEKCDRLFELYFRYEERVLAEEARLAAALAEQEAAEGEGEESDDEEEGLGRGIDADTLLMARMDAGLYTLQQCCVIVGYLWCTADVGLRKRILTLLHQKGQTLGSVREYLFEFYQSLAAEGANTDDQSAQLDRLRNVLEGMGQSFEAPKAQHMQEDAPPAPPHNAADAAAMPPPPLPSGHPPTNGTAAVSKEEDMDVDAPADSHAGSSGRQEGTAVEVEAAPVLHRSSRDRDREGGQQTEKGHFSQGGGDSGGKESLGKRSREEAVQDGHASKRGHDPDRRDERHRDGSEPTGSSRREERHSGGGGKRGSEREQDADGRVIGSARERNDRDRPLQDKADPTDREGGKEAERGAVERDRNKDRDRERERERERKTEHSHKERKEGDREHGKDRHRDSEKRKEKSKDRDRKGDRRRRSHSRSRSR